MYLACYALLTVAGAWFAWRGNPLFSIRRTLRFIVMFALVIAALIGWIVAGVNVAMKVSDPYAYFVIGFVVLTGTIAMIWAIIALTTPRVVLPSSVRIVNVHRIRVLHWLRAFGVAVLGFAVLAVALPGEWKVVPSILGGMTLFLGIVMLSTGYIAAFNLDRSLTAVEAEPWFHWRYTPERWNAWAQMEVARSIATTTSWDWSRDGRRLLFPIGALALAIGVFDPGPWNFKVGYLAVVIALITGLSWGSNRYAKGAPSRMRRLLSGIAPESYLGSAGIFADGTYTQWQTASNYLTNASIDEREPRSLTFDFEKIVAGGTTIRTRQHVLLPSDAGNDLPRLQTLVSAACPSADVRLSA